MHPRKILINHGQNWGGLNLTIRCEELEGDPLTAEEKDEVKSTLMPCILSFTSKLIHYDEEGILSAKTQ